MYWKIINMEMNLWELAIHLNILNIPKDCQRICGDFIFTMVCRVSGINHFCSELVQLCPTACP